MAELEAEIQSPQQFSDRLEAKILAANLDNALALIKDDANAEWIDGTILTEMLVKHLTDGNLKSKPNLYNCCEEALKALVEKCQDGDMILGLLEVIDSSNCDETVVSVLKAMQLCLLHPNNKIQDNAQMLEWSLNSIQQYASEIPLSVDARNGLDKEEEQLLEEESEVRRILSFHFFIVYFYESILERILTDEPTVVNHFRITSLSARNVLSCFLIQLFHKPLGYLNFTDPSSDENSTCTNGYTRTILKLLTRDIGKVMPNPLILLAYGERRARWPYILPDSNDYETVVSPISDFFLIDEKAPTIAIGILLYTLLVEGMAPPTMPCIYNPIYMFEMGLYFVTKMLESSEETFRTKGLRLALKLLDDIKGRSLGDDTLELNIHLDFTKNLVHVLDTTSVRRNSESGVLLLRNYIQKFETTGAKYFHIRNLFEYTDNNKIRSLLVTIFKDIIANELKSIDSGELDEISPFCRGDKLKELMLNTICVLPKGVETDLLQSNDVIIATLNALIFLGRRDSANHTQLWDFISEIGENYLRILEKAIDVTGAHYRLEEKRIEETNRLPDDEPMIEIANAPYLSMATENRLQVIRIGQNTFHLIESLLTRLNEIIEQRNNQIND